MFETIFFDPWVKHPLWILLSQLHWTKSLELIYIAWLWAAQSKSCLFAFKNLMFYIFDKGVRGWHEPNNFLIAPLLQKWTCLEPQKWLLSYFTSWNGRIWTLSIGIIEHWTLEYRQCIELNTATSKVPILLVALRFTKL